MQKFIRLGETVEAVQFFSNLEWPETVKKWENYVPRDMSWGYVDTERGRVHILQGDWIIKKGNGKLDVCYPDVFQTLYKPVKQQISAEPDIPRRIRIDLNTPAELAIRNAMIEVEKAGADVLLTQAIVLLQQAKDKVSDYVDQPK